jgi:hypothetical protein
MHGSCAATECVVSNDALWFQDASRDVSDGSTREPEKLPDARTATAAKSSPRDSTSRLPFRSRTAASREPRTSGEFAEAVSSIRLLSLSGRRPQRRSAPLTTSDFCPQKY